MNAVVEFPLFDAQATYSEIDFEFSPESRTLYSWMKPQPRPCFTPGLLADIRRSEQQLELHQGHIAYRGAPQRVDWMVYGSRVDDVFNLGGDLSLFVQAILRRDRETIHEYARTCVDLIYRRYTGFGADITTIGLVQGKALGGGFECALACDYIIAERSATFALPESLFNLFPGMGALSFLSRKVGMAKAEELCSSAETKTAQELQAMGVVDLVVEDGLGVESVRKFIAQKARHQNTVRAIKAAKRFVQPVSSQELYDVVDVWTDAALKLEARDLKMMTRLVKAQDRMLGQTEEEAAVEMLLGTDNLQAAA